MYVKRFFIPPICSHRVEDFLENVLLPLYESGNLDILSMLVKRNYACFLVSAGGATALVRCTPGEVSIASGSKQALNILLKLFLKRLSELCRRGRSPELLLVFVGDSSLPDAESKIAAALARSSVRASIFSAFFVMLHWFLSNAIGVNFSLSMLLSLVITSFTATIISPFLVLHAIPRWRIPRDRRVKIYRVVLERLDDEVYTTALLAKASISKRSGVRLGIDEVRRVLEEWGVPVREVKLLEYDLNTMLSDCGGTTLYITSVPGITAFSLGFARRFSSMLLNAELLVDLEPEELSAVLEHELEHLRHRDTIFLSTALMLGIAPLAFVHLLAVQASALAAYLVTLSALLILLCRAVEVRADLAAAAEKGAEPLKRALVKLEYAELLRSMPLRGRILSLLNPSPQPPAWLRIVILEKYSRRGRSLLWAILANILALKLAAEFEHVEFDSAIVCAHVFTLGAPAQAGLKHQQSTRTAQGLGLEPR